jgi:hypothetical protein
MAKPPKNKKTKKVKTIEEYLELLADKKKVYAEKYKTSISQAKASDNDENLMNKLNLRTGNYSLRTRIKKNPWVSKGRPASSAISWLWKTVFKDPKTYRYPRQLIYQGGLFIFEYKNPKYKDTPSLPWFDQYPLVLSLGPIVTKKGIRNIGFNLHLVPPKIRVIILCGIFEMFKRIYRYQIFFKQDKPVQINYKKIVGSLEQYGVKFCVRMYIPQRMNQIVRFPIKDWHKAIFLPSRGYYGIRAAKLVNAWKSYNRRNGNLTNANIDWKTNI